MPEFLTHVGAELAVVGSLPQLGAWQAQGAQRLAWAPGHRWSADIALPAGWEGDIEYKVCIVPACMGAQNVAVTKFRKLPVNFSQFRNCPPSCGPR